MKEILNEKKATFENDLNKQILNYHIFDEQICQEQIITMMMTYLVGLGLPWDP